MGVFPVRTQVLDGLVSNMRGYQPKMVSLAKLSICWFESLFSEMENQFDVENIGGTLRRVAAAL